MNKEEIENKIYEEWLKRVSTIEKKENNFIVYNENNKINYIKVELSKDTNKQEVFLNKKIVFDDKKIKINSLSANEKRDIISEDINRSTVFMQINKITQTNLFLLTPAMQKAAFMFFKTNPHLKEFFFVVDERFSIDIEGLQEHIELFLANKPTRNEIYLFIEQEVSKMCKSFYILEKNSIANNFEQLFDDQIVDRNNSYFFYNYSESHLPKISQKEFDEIESADKYMERVGKEIWLNLFVKRYFVNKITSLYAKNIFYQQYKEADKHLFRKKTIEKILDFIYSAANYQAFFDTLVLPLDEKAEIAEEIEEVRKLLAQDDIEKYLSENVFTKAFLVQIKNFFLKENKRVKQFYKVDKNVVNKNDKDYLIAKNSIEDYSALTSNNEQNLFSVKYYTDNKKIFKSNKEIKQFIPDRKKINEELYLLRDFTQEKLFKQDREYMPKTDFFYIENFKNFFKLIEFIKKQCLKDNYSIYSKKIYAFVFAKDVFHEEKFIAYLNNFTGIYAQTDNGQYAAYVRIDPSTFSLSHSLSSKKNKTQVLKFHKKNSLNIKQIYLSKKITAHNSDLLLLIFEQMFSNNLYTFADAETEKEVNKDLIKKYTDGESICCATYFNDTLFKVLKQQQIVSEWTKEEKNSFFEEITEHFDVAYYDKIFPDLVNLKSQNKLSAYDIFSNPINHKYFFGIDFFKKLLTNIFAAQNIDVKDINSKVFSLKQNDKNNILLITSTQPYEKSGIFKMQNFPIIFSLKDGTDKDNFLSIVKNIAIDKKVAIDDYIEQIKDIFAKNENLYLILKNDKIFDKKSQYFGNRNIFVLVDKYFQEIKIVPFNYISIYEEMIKMQIFSPKKNINNITINETIFSRMIEKISILTNEFFDEEKTENFNYEKFVKDFYIAIDKYPNLFISKKSNMKNIVDDAQKEKIYKQTIYIFLTNFDFNKNRYKNKYVFIKTLIKNNLKGDFDEEKIPDILSSIGLHICKKHFEYILTNRDFSNSSIALKDFLYFALKLKIHQTTEVLNYFLLSKSNSKYNTNNLFWEMRTGKTRVYIALSLLNAIFEKKESLIFIQNKNIFDILKQAKDMNRNLVKYITLIGEENKDIDKEIIQASLPINLTDQILPNIPLKIAKFTQNPFKNSNLSPKELLNKTFISTLEKIKPFVKDLDLLSQKDIYKKVLMQNLSFENKDFIMYLKKLFYIYLKHLEKNNILKKEFAEQAAIKVKKEIDKIENIFEFYQSSVQNRQIKNGITFISKNVLYNYKNVTVSESKFIIEKEFEKKLPKNKKVLSFAKVLTSLDIKLNTEKINYAILNKHFLFQKDIKEFTEIEDKAKENLLKINKQIEDFFDKVETSQEIKQISRDKRIIAPSFLNYKAGKERIKDNTLTRLYSGIEDYSLAKLFERMDQMFEIFEKENSIVLPDNIKLTSQGIVKNILYKPIKNYLIFSIQNDNNLKNSAYYDTNIIIDNNKKLPLETIELPETLVNKIYKEEHLALVTSNLLYALEKEGFEQRQVLVGYLSALLEEFYSAKNLAVVINDFYYKKLLSRLFYQQDDNNVFIGQKMLFYKFTGNIPNDTKVYKVIEKAANFSINISLKDNCQNLLLPVEKNERQTSSLPIAQINFLTDIVRKDYKNESKNTIINEIVFESNFQRNKIKITKVHYMHNNKKYTVKDRIKILSNLKTNFLWEVNQEKNSIGMLCLDEAHQEIGNTITQENTRKAFKRLSSQEGVLKIIGTGTPYTGNKKIQNLLSFADSEQQKFKLGSNLIKYSISKKFKNIIYGFLYQFFISDFSLKNATINMFEKHFKSLSEIFNDKDSNDERNFYKIMLLFEQEPTLQLLIKKVFEKIKQEQANNRTLSTSEIKEDIISFIQNFFQTNLKIFNSKNKTDKNSSMRKILENAFELFLKKIVYNKDIVKIDNTQIDNFMNFTNIVISSQQANFSVGRSYKDIKYNVLDCDTIELKSETPSKQPLSKENSLLKILALSKLYQKIFFTKPLETSFKKFIELFKEVAKDDLSFFDIKNQAEYNFIFNRSNATIKDSVEDIYIQYLNGEKYENLLFKDEKTKKVFDDILLYIDQLVFNYDTIKSNAVKKIKTNNNLVLSFGNKKATISPEKFLQIELNFFSEEIEFKTINSIKNPQEYNNIFGLSSEKGLPTVVEVANQKNKSPIYFKTHFKYVLPFSKLHNEGVFPPLKISFATKNLQDKQLLEILAYSSHTFNIVCKEVNDEQNIRVMTSRNVLTQSAFIFLCEALIQRKNKDKEAVLIANVTDQNLSVDFISKIDKENFKDKYNITIIETSSKEIDNIFNKYKNNKDVQIILVGNSDALSEGFDMSFIDKGIYYGVPQTTTSFIQSVARQIGLNKNYSDFYLFNNGALGTLKEGNTKFYSSDFFENINKIFNHSFVDIDKIAPYLKGNFVFDKLENSFAFNGIEKMYKYLQGYNAFMNGKIDFIKEQHANYIKDKQEKIFGIVQKEKIKKLKL